MARAALRHLLARQITDGPHESPEFIDDGVPFLSVDNVIDGELTFDPCRFISELDHARFSAKAKPVKGDVLITKAASVGRVACVDVDFEFNIWSPIAILRPEPATLAQRYLYFFLQSLDAQAQLQRGATSNTQQNIAMGDIGSLLVPMHTLADQRAIADYLDAETARIDALIAKKQQLIHLLEERRSAFVGTAVTTGLEHVPMRETGDDLIPTVPVGWRLMRLRHLVERIVDTPHKTAPVVEAEEYLVARTANVKKGRLVYTDARYTDIESWKEWNRNGAPRSGDVLFTREAPAGEACVVPPDQPLCLGQRMVLFQVDRRRTTGEWLVHSIYAGPAQRFIEVYSNSTTVAHLNMSDIPDIPIAVPPQDEQRRLLAAIERVDDTVRDSKETLARQLHLLAEHRQALITAAITGEFAVPGAA